MRRAFTIIELLVVITIIGILLGAAGILGSHALLVNRDSQRLSDVLLISKSIDEYNTTTRGSYPVNSPTASNKNIMCVQDLQSSGMNLGQFTNQTIPKDPRPASSSSTCSSFLNGYTYHTWYPPSGSNTTSLQNACTDPLMVNSAATTSLAICQNVAYSIEVGLEGDKPSDEPLFHKPSELSEVGLDDKTMPLRNSFLDQSPDDSSRTRFILNGPTCQTWSERYNPSTNTYSPCYR